MISTENIYIYEAFGFRIESNIPLPELRGSGHRSPQLDYIKIQVTDLTPLWRKYSMPNQLSCVVNGDIMFKVPDTAIFYVQSGNNIHVSPASQADWDKIRLYLLGTCMGFILMQRKILPLHGSAINISGKAYAILGDSGAGKSTLATTLISMGHRLLSDDLIAVTFDHHRTPIVNPSYPQQKLWVESIQKLDMNVRSYRPLFGRENKYAIPADEYFYNDPLPFGGAFELVKADEDVIYLKALSGLAGIHMLYRQTFRNSYISRLGLQEWHFKTSVDLTASVMMYQIRRPVTGFTVHELAEAILTRIHREELQ